MKFSADELCIIKPSKIIDVDGKIIEERKSNIKFVEQLVTFELLAEKTVIAHKNLWYYEDFFNKENKAHLDGSMGDYSRIYYDALQLKNSGVTSENVEREYYNLFDGDKILLTDFILSNDMNKKDFFTGIKKSKHQLKTKAQLFEQIPFLENKKYYTLEELKILKEKLSSMIEKPMYIQKKYKVIKKPTKRIFIDHSFISEGPKYVGINNQQINNPKILKKQI